MTEQGTTPSRASQPKRRRHRAATPAIALALAATASMAQPTEQRLQLGQYQPETPLAENRSEPQITGVRRSDGDLEVLIDQPAPCGAWVPINPRWGVRGSQVTLTYDWHPMSKPVAEPPGLCMKHIRAWVFRVPEARYEVRITDYVPRFERVGNAARRVTFESSWTATESLCKPGEVVLVNARLLPPGMAPQDPRAEEYAVSLCADSEQEPIRQLAYRFGAQGATALEIAASAQAQAGVFRQSDNDAHLGVIGVVFYAKPYVYVVSEGLGMASGLTLSVYKDTRRVAAFSSPDYVSRLATLSPDAPKSPVFKRVKPMEPL